MSDSLHAGVGREALHRVQAGLLPVPVAERPQGVFSDMATAAFGP
ncbi:hypothetical protein QFZ42_002935 [Variovorax paradoxus]|nr:hypothetical protein [Variovorax paradoxus]MDQ0571101.1 hypothetical protein [Variovorax paradoxus]